MLSEDQSFSAIINLKTVGIEFESRNFHTHSARTIAIHEMLIFPVILGREKSPNNE